MSGYETDYEFFDDSARLIEAGASLRELYDAFRTVAEPNHLLREAMPERLLGLATGWPQRPYFVPIRFAELFEGLVVEHTDDYVLALVGSLGGRHEQEIRLHFLRHDHELRDGVFWRVFEVEGGGEISLANVDKYSREDLNWHHTVLLLTNEGTLDRARVLRSCLEALNRDFSAYRAGWFSRLYTALAPTPAEAAADQELLRLCLASSVGATVTLAVTQLAAVQKAGMLDAPAFVEACAPALTGTKAQATKVLTTLGKLTNDSSFAEPITAAIVQALGHPHADVQRTAAKALIARGRTELLAAHRAELAPAVAAEFAEALATVVRGEDAGASLDTAGASHGGTASGEDTVTPPPYLAQLPEPQPVLPWRDDEALERFAALLETPSDAIEFELALAWLATAERPSETLTPLAKRVSRITNSDPDRYGVASLVLAAVEPEREFLPQEFYQRYESRMVDGEWVYEPVGEPEPRDTAEQASALPSLVTRMREVAAILQGRAMRRPLLATPTDTLGWIDPDILLARFQAARATSDPSDCGETFLSGAGIQPFPADLTQALLRVRPEHLDRVLRETRQKAPERTGAITIEWRNYVSGGQNDDGSPQWVWWGPEIQGSALPEPSALNPALIPSQAREFSWYENNGTDLVFAELALVDPASTAPLTAAGVSVLQGAVSETSEHRAGAVLTALAGHAGTWTAETMQLVALGMSASQAQHRAQAAELFAAAIPVRLDAAGAAAAFAVCAPACTLTRWAVSFTDAATLHPRAVIDVLTALLPQLDRTTRGIGALLTVLLDESLRASCPATEPVLRDWLTTFTGSSASAKTARTLLTTGPHE